MSSLADWLSKTDFYRHEYDQFQWDVHILIEGTLDASIRYLGTQTKTELAKLEAVMQKALDDEFHQHLVDEHGVVQARNSSQEQFLRNMALVALTSVLAQREMEKRRSPLV